MEYLLCYKYISISQHIQIWQSVFGRIFGFHFLENFNYPYISKSITEFWRRWHISLSSWFKDYVYIPLGGNRVGKLKLLRNILVVWLLTGLWHGANWTFILWGLIFAILLIIEKFFLLKRLEKTPKILNHIYVLFIVMISFIIFNSESIKQAKYQILGLFGANGETFINQYTLYYLKSYAVILAIAIVGATPFSKNVIEKLNYELIKNLKESRKKLDIKQKDVAKLFKVDISTVSGWETGKDMIPLRKLIDYANYFNYSLDYLFGISKENIAYEPLTINLEVIAKNLKRIRKNNNMNQAYVAKRINTSQSAYSHYETATNLITTTFLFNLTKVYDKFSIDELLGRKKIKSDQVTYFFAVFPNSYILIKK